MSQVALDLDLDDGGEPTFSVGELAELVNAALQRRFSDGVWVRGEIQGWNKSTAGHIYFNLVDIDDHTGQKCTLRVAFFAGAQRGPRELFRRYGLKLGDGLKVRIFGTLDFFAGSGQLSFKMTAIDPRFTLGEMALQRDQVVRQLVAAGLYDANRSRPLAVAPIRVGVVASVGSAAWADFHHELQRSGLGFELRVVDVRVQGEWAVEMVTGALRQLCRAADLDVVVLIRGGGSRTELATFDDVRIATAIAQSMLPVFTGLGHEIDRSVADEVAHSALKTPTACATALVEHVAAYQQRAELAWEAIQRCAERSTQHATVGLAELANAIRARTLAAVQRSDERLSHRAARVRHGATRAVDFQQQRLTSAVAAVRRVPARLEPEVRHLNASAARVRLLDPVHTMARGWSITRTADGRTVRDPSAVAPGEQLITTVATGTITSRVEESPE